MRSFDFQPIGRKKAAAVLSVLLGMSACVPRSIPPPILAPASPTPAPPEDAPERILIAGVLLGRGSLASIRAAVEIYSRLYSYPELKDRLAEPFLEADLLLAVREKELGIWNSAALDHARTLIKTHPFLVQDLPLADIAADLQPRGEGVVLSPGELFHPERIAPALAAGGEEFEAAAGRNAVRAYLYAAFRWPEPKTPDEIKALDVVLDRFPQNFLLQYKRAVSPVPDTAVLKELAALEPSALEINYHLGAVSFGGGKLLEAEKRFRKALPAMGSSQALLIRLGGIHLLLEEFEEGEKIYDLALAALPRNREALLDKAVCRGYLGGNDEAMAVLNRIIELGEEMNGEARYWLAWNFHQLRDLDRAADNAGLAKKLLPGKVEPLVLSGLIAMDQADFAGAERDFLDALRINPNVADALFNLGKIYGQKNLWEKSARYFAGAGSEFGKTEEEAGKKVQEARSSSMAEPRKTKYIARKEAQVRLAGISKATAFYNAAAGFNNAGIPVLAEVMARQAAAHPAFAGLAENLLKLLRKTPVPKPE